MPLFLISAHTCDRCPQVRKHTGDAPSVQQKEVHVFTDEAVGDSDFICFVIRSCGICIKMLVTSGCFILMINPTISHPTANDNLPVHNA